MVVAAVDGHVQAALWLFLAAMVIDGTDGLMARRLRVKEVTPWFDGALLDNIVDYLTYCLRADRAPALGGRLPALGVRRRWFAAGLPLLASTYQFCRSDAKTDDHFFLGFPSYWNVLAFYVVVLGLGHAAAAALLVVFSVLVFVPVKYVYPSRTETLWSPTWRPRRPGSSPTPSSWRRCPTLTRSCSGCRWPTSRSTPSSRCS